MNLGLKTVDQSVLNSTRDVDKNQIEELKNRMRENVFNECELLKASFRDLVELVIDGNAFIRKEIDIRKKVPIISKLI